MVCFSLFVDVQQRHRMGQTKQLRLSKILPHTLELLRLQPPHPRANALMERRGSLMKMEIVIAHRKCEKETQ